MKLCITEKPSVARDIAAILGANVRHDGYFEGGEYCITWTYGHLCTLKDPVDYTDAWKHWRIASLPMIPPRFGIKVIDTPSIKKQFKVIETLIARADEVINCGDAGQEGELIQRWVMQRASIKCPVKRLWISSLTDESIRAGFSELRPENNFDNLYFAGLSRAIGDWLLGLNATRLYSLKYSEPGRVLSVGRVQTPTLALVVQRQREIENFKPENYWELRTRYREATFNSTAGRFKSEESAREALQRIVDAPLVITDIKEKSGRESAPRLFDLTSLQVECNKLWGWSADQSLKLIQTLYEKKVTTYPRVDTTYLTDDIYKKVPDIMRRMEPYANLIAPLLEKPLVKSKKVFDNSKVTDHHAIIPTGQSPRILEGDEKRMYHLIALRFIGVFYPDCRFNTTTVMADVAGVGFKAQGKVITDAGWRVLWPQKAAEKSGEDASDNLLPEFTVGEQGKHEPEIAKGTTQPPKYYNEGTLLRAMETAGRTVDDDELRDAMKENGLGRPSTRAAIIEKLYERGYIVRERKSIRATSAGMELIDIIQNDLLKSAKLTGLWENKLRRIERGEYSAGEFINELKVMITEIVSCVTADVQYRRINVTPASEVPAKKKSGATGTSRKKKVKNDA